jgi:hypothetical protein
MAVPPESTWSTRPLLIVRPELVTPDETTMGGGTSQDPSIPGQRDQAGSVRRVTDRIPMAARCRGGDRSVSSGAPYWRIVNL